MMFDRNEEDYEGEAYQDGYATGQEEKRDRILKLLDEAHKKKEKELLEMVQKEKGFKKRALEYIGVIAIFKDILKRKIKGE